ncbi:hypothetical protein GUJ93_ZPchr0009g357 [Zizania palustris]|uniref:Uncharacterized protein n=1 Tax=Zizania palustris TaxID=103762 RepID=A0A8J5RKP9_ZIZPA|nr:hypothetical protein GUJ93_ZPchr0009g357 [Zizania palustris]
MQTLITCQRHLYSSAKCPVGLLKKASEAKLQCDSASAITEGKLRCDLAQASFGGKLCWDFQVTLFEVSLEASTSGFCEALYGRLHTSKAVEGFGQSSD